MGKAKSEECYRYIISTGFRRRGHVQAGGRDGEPERVIHRIRGIASAALFTALDRKDEPVLNYRSRIPITETYETFEAARQEAMRRLEEEIRGLKARTDSARTVLRALFLEEDTTETVPTKRTRQKKIH